MIKTSLEQVINKTHTKENLNDLLLQYKNSRETLTNLQEKALYKQLTAVIKTPASKVLTSGWRSPHGVILYGSSRLEMEDLISEGIMHTLEKINQYNPQKAATTFVYLKIEEHWRREIIPKLNTPFHICKETYERLEPYQRTTIVQAESIEQLENNSNNDKEKKIVTIKKLPVYEHDLNFELTIEQIKTTVLETDLFSPLEKQVFRLSSGLFDSFLEDKEIEEFTNGEISRHNYRSTKFNIKKKLKNIYNPNSQQQHSIKPKSKQIKRKEIEKSQIQLINEIQANINNQLTGTQTTNKPTNLVQHSNQAKEIKTTRTTTKLEDSFPIRSKFYLSMYNNSEPKSTITKKLVTDISQIINKSLTQIISEHTQTQKQHEKHYNISQYKQDIILTNISQQILNKLEINSSQTLEDINLNLQTQYNQAIENITQFIEESKPKPTNPNIELKPLSSNIKFKKSKTKKLKKKHQNKGSKN